MIHSIMWLLVLQIAITNFVLCERWRRGELSVEEPAGFFDYNLCDDKDGLNWACFIPIHCTRNPGPHGMELKVTTPLAYEANDCDVVLAIQQQTPKRSDPKKWRVVMQTRANGVSNVDLGRPQLNFLHSNKELLNCQAHDNSVRVLVDNYNQYTITNAKGRFDRINHKFMCEFTIDFGERFGTNYPDGLTGIKWLKVSDPNMNYKAEMTSSEMASYVDEKVQCNLDLVESFDKELREIKIGYEHEDVLKDRLNIKCRDGFTLLPSQKSDLHKTADKIEAGIVVSSTVKRMRPTEFNPTLMCENGEWKYGNADHRPMTLDESNFMFCVKI